MGKSYERGQQEAIEALEAWEEVGATSMRDMSEHLGKEVLEELREAQERGDENHAEYFKGMLSRLD